ncbi:MAG TPA: hypothetical protein VJ505_12995 [Holophagaceae bacterium]|nr:hypothetical protein [Holophagaceae bacterium]
MNFKRLSLALAGVVIAGASLAAQTAPAPGTQTATPKREAHMEKRSERQQKRIAQGVKTGALTPRETARLEHQEAKVNKDIAKAEADGKVTKKEAAKIEREQNKESRRIHRQKHDVQTRK